MDMDGKFHIHGKPGARACSIEMWGPLAHNFFTTDRRPSKGRSKIFYVGRDAEHAWIGLWLVCTVQTVPRVRKKDIAEGRKFLRPDAAAAQAPSRPSDVATGPSLTSATYDSVMVRALSTDRWQTNDISYPKLDLTVGRMWGNKIM